MNPLFNKPPDPGRSNVFLANLRERGDEMELWTSFRSGSRQALNTIFDKYARVLISYGKNICPDQQLILDCMQDVFVELWVKRETLTPSVSSIKYYLIKSVRRRLLRRLSSEKRFAGDAVPENYSKEVEFNIEVNLIRDQISIERSLQLKASVATLSKKQQEAVYLKFYENMSYGDIASVMNTDVKAVYNLIAKSIAALRKFFDVNPIPCD